VNRKGQDQNATPIRQNTAQKQQWRPEGRHCRHKVGRNRLRQTRDPQRLAHPGHTGIFAFTPWPDATTQPLR
jgi:hypothetical protein